MSFGFNVRTRSLLRRCSESRSKWTLSIRSSVPSAHINLVSQDLCKILITDKNFVLNALMIGEQKILSSGKSWRPSIKSITTVYTFFISLAESPRSVVSSGAHQVEFIALKLIIFLKMSLNSDVKVCLIFLSGSLQINKLEIFTKLETVVMWSSLLSSNDNQTKSNLAIFLKVVISLICSTSGLLNELTCQAKILVSTE